MVPTDFKFNIFIISIRVIKLNCFLCSCNDGTVGQFYSEKHQCVSMHFESLGCFTEADHVMSLPAAVYGLGAASNGCSIF